MRRIRKKNIPMKAFCLGTGSRMEQELIAEGRIVDHGDGTYEIFSKEAMGQKGETAHRGDYIKFSTDGLPYPNKREVFARSHVKVGEDFYRQSGTVLYAWEAGEDKDEAMRFILAQGLLKIQEEDPAHYFHAHIWGTDLYQSKDALVVFYQVERNANGQIVQVEFNLLSREDFEKTYDYV